MVLEKAYRRAASGRTAHAAAAWQTRPAWGAQALFLLLPCRGAAPAATTRPLVLFSSDRMAFQTRPATGAGRPASNARRSAALNAMKRASGSCNGRPPLPRRGAPALPLASAAAAPPHAAPAAFAKTTLPVGGTHVKLSRFAGSQKPQPAVYLQRGGRAEPCLELGQGHGALSLHAIDGSCHGNPASLLPCRTRASRGQEGLLQLLHRLPWLQTLQQPHVQEERAEVQWENCYLPCARLDRRLQGGAWPAGGGAGRSGSCHATATCQGRGARQDGSCHAMPCPGSCHGRGARGKAHAMPCHATAACHADRRPGAPS